MKTKIARTSSPPGSKNLVDPLLRRKARKIVIALIIIAFLAALLSYATPPVSIYPQSFQTQGGIHVGTQ